MGRGGGVVAGACAGYQGAASVKKAQEAEGWSSL
jgi:hypothetical protein